MIKRRNSKDVHLRLLKISKYQMRFDFYSLWHNEKEQNEVRIERKRDVYLLTVLKTRDLKKKRG